MSPTKNSPVTASESSRPRKVSTQKKSKAFKQRKIPKALDKVPLCIYGAKLDDFINGDTTIKPAVASESLAPSSMDVTNPQDTADLASYFPPANFDQIPVLPTRVPVYRVTEPSESQVPFQYSSTFNNQSEDDNILSSSSNPCQSCGRFDPPSSSTDSLSMECGVDPYQLQQLLDPNTQYFIDSLFPQHISPYVSNSSPDSDNSYGDIYPEITVTGSSESHLMTSANDGTTLPFPNFDAYNPHHDNYCM